FFLYLWAVFALVICPLPIDPEEIDWLRKLEHWHERINLIPTFFFGHFYLDENVRGNFLLGIPFGFGLPFVVAPKNSTPKYILGIGIGFAAGLELIQLGISLA